MTVSEELKTKIKRKMWKLFRCRERMGDRIGDNDARKMVQDGKLLYSEIQPLLESEELEELKDKIWLYAQTFHSDVKMMQKRLDPLGEDEEASKIMQEADGLWAEIKDLLEIEE